MSRKQVKIFCTTETTHYSNLSTKDLASKINQDIERWREIEETGCCDSPSCHDINIVKAETSCAITRCGDQATVSLTTTILYTTVRRKP